MASDDGVWKRGAGNYNRRGGNKRRGYIGRGGRHPQTREDDDGDTYMEGTPDKSRYQPYQRAHMDNVPRGSSGSRGRSSSVFSRLGLENSGLSSGGSTRSERYTRPSQERSTWHKVTVKGGAFHSKEWLMRSLKESINEPFMAMQMHQLGDKVMFYLEDPRAAKELSNVKTITSKDGPLVVTVYPSAPPKGIHDGGRGGGRGGGGGGGGGGHRRGAAPYERHRDKGGMDSSDDVVMEEGSAEVIQQVLGERFDIQSRALNLTDMFNEKKFRDHGMRVNMYDKRFVGSMLSIIGEQCPDLLELNLSNNRIQHLESYVDLPVKCANLKILDLSSNKIWAPTELEHVKGMAGVTTLSLKNNPVAEQARDFSTYSSSIRKYFPSLEFLDGQSLPKPVKFDLPVAVNSLPTYVKNHLPNDQVKELVVKFLEQYYTLYDGASRDKLLEAYGEEALFSLCVTPPENHRDHHMQKYFSKSRNLIRVQDPGKRQSLLKHGRIDIVQHIRDLPPTRHRSELFEVDINNASGSEVCFVVYGAFSEEGDRKEVLVRSFTRTFILALAGTSVVIMNDMLDITNASSKTVQYVQDKVRNSQTSVFGTSGVATASPAPGPTAVSATALGTTALTTNVQEETIRKLAEASKMNFVYCEKCLSENNWDLSAALSVFQALQVQGQIPQEAFL